ncbi:hypothetical protein ASALC70_00897 [Alcanivorax sp. ALC70]|nr:hypothetical protein ASALC70_00897 [Alcanivorax sp. ALC70]
MGASITPAPECVEDEGAALHFQAAPVRRRPAPPCRRCAVRSGGRRRGSRDNILVVQQVVHLGVDLHVAVQVVGGGQIHHHHVVGAVEAVRARPVTGVIDAHLVHVDGGQVGAPPGGTLQPQGQAELVFRQIGQYIAAHDAAVIGILADLAVGIGIGEAHRSLQAPARHRRLLMPSSRPCTRDSPKLCEPLVLPLGHGAASEQLFTVFS